MLPLRSHLRIALQVTCMGDTLQRITLSLSPTFVLHCPTGPLKDALLAWLHDYSQGKWTPFPLPPHKTSFGQKAAHYLQSTHPGTLLSYGEVAQAIGHPGAARAIGTFCSSNLFPLLMPCHRVIPAARRFSGHLGAYTPDPRIKEELLQFEASFGTPPASIRGRT